LTILLNVLIWDQHAKPGGIASLGICVMGGMIYQQAPMRGSGGADNKQIAMVSAEDDAFKADASSLEQEDDDETMDLIEKQDTPAANEANGSTAKRRN
jgi:GDP-mannose transporter